LRLRKLKEAIKGENVSNPAPARTQIGGLIKPGPCDYYGS
jgi:hypothetical protein